jgi:hypothetical protein
MLAEDPFLALSAAYALVEAGELIGGRLRQRLLFPALIGLGVVLFAAIPFYRNVQWDRLMAHGSDPRTAALTWAEANIPAGTVVAIQPLFNRSVLNAPLLTSERLAKIDDDIPDGGRFDEVRDQVFATLAARPQYQSVPFRYDYDYLLEAGVRYVFISSGNWFFDEQAVAQSEAAEQAVTEDLQAQIAFRDALETRAVLAQRFQPDLYGLDDSLPFAQMPPEITVYELR